MIKTKQAAPTGTPRSAKAKFAGIVLVCSKCAKRQSLSPKSVRGRVKAAAKGSGRKLRVVETGCLGPCPKRHLALATGASVAAGRIVLVDPAADAEAMARAVLPDFGPKAGLPAVPGGPWTPQGAS